MRFDFLFSCALLLTLLFQISGVASGQHIEVGPGPGQVPTITQALAQASSNTLIEIHPRIGNADYVLGLNGEATDLRTYGKDGITFRGNPGPAGPIVINGNYDPISPGGSTGAYALEIRADLSRTDPSNNIHVENLTFKNCRGAIWADGQGSGHKFTNVTLDQNYALGAICQADNCIFRNCVFKRSWDDTFFNFNTGLGLWVHRGHGTQLIDCRAEDNNSHGYRIEANSCKVTNCDSKSNGYQGMLVIGTAANPTVDLKIEGGIYEENEATGIQIENNCSEVVVRNVTARNNNGATYPAARPSEAGIWIDCSKDILIEDCHIYGNQHGLKISADFAGGAPAPVGPAYCEDMIIRFNCIYNNNKNVSAGPSGSALSFFRAKQLAFYHNTIWNNGTASGPQNHTYTKDHGYDRGGFGARLGSPYTNPSNPDLVPEDVNSRISCKNNVIGKINGYRGSHMMQFYQHASGYIPEIRELARNVYFSPPTTEAYHIGQSRYPFSAPRGVTSYKSYMAGHGGHEAGTVESIVQPINDSDLVPINGGDAHEKAYPLTSVAYIHTGNWIQVDNGNYFRRGDQLRFTGPAWGATVAQVIGDLIELTTTPAGSIAGADVWLNRPFNGTRPDIGAVERGLPSEPNGRPRQALGYAPAAVVAPEPTVEVPTSAASVPKAFGGGDCWLCLCRYPRRSECDRQAGRRFSQRSLRACRFRDNSSASRSRAIRRLRSR